MNPIITASYQLSKGGYSAYFTPSKSMSFVIEDPRGVLSKVILRKASPTESTPILTLSPKFKSSEYMQNFGYCLIVEVEEPKLWLIPVSEFPTDHQSLRLGERFEQYVIGTQQESLPAERLRRSIQSRIGGAGSIRQEDLEDLLTQDID
jgi:hypothetical protein